MGKQVQWVKELRASERWKALQRWDNGYSECDCTHAGVIWGTEYIACADMPETIDELRSMLSHAFAAGEKWAELADRPSAVPRAGHSIALPPLDPSTESIPINEAIALFKVMRDTPQEHRARLLLTAWLYFVADEVVAAEPSAHEANAPQ